MALRLICSRPVADVHACSCLQVVVRVHDACFTSGEQTAASSCIATTTCARTCRACASTVHPLLGVHDKGSCRVSVHCCPAAVAQRCWAR